MVSCSHILITQINTFGIPIGVLIPSIALIMMGYVKSNEATKAVWLLIAAVGLSAIGGCGWSLNHMDLSPNHAGTLMGICNGLSNILAAFAPLSVQFLVKDEVRLLIQFKNK